MGQGRRVAELFCGEAAYGVLPAARVFWRGVVYNPVGCLTRKVLLLQSDADPQQVTLFLVKSTFRLTDTGHNPLAMKARG